MKNILFFKTENQTYNNPLFKTIPNPSIIMFHNNNTRIFKSYFTYESHSGCVHSVTYSRKFQVVDSL